MMLRVLIACLSCTLLLHQVTSAPQPLPQRSVQLGGAGPRPVALGGPQPQYQGGPIYTQQLAFGPPAGAPFQPLQASPSPPPSSPARIRIAQPQQPSPGAIPQPTPGPGRPFSLQPFPGAPPLSPSRQPIVLKSPSVQEEEEYEDEEYEEEPVAPVRAQPAPRPAQQSRGPTRNITPQPVLISSPQPGPGPQRFVIPQQPIQPQPTPQQISRRPQGVPLRQQSQPAFSAAPIQVQPARQQQVVSQAPPRANALGSDSRLKNRVSTPPPVQTINRFMRNNPDGSITWGYENEDGTFKEETLGADCVVRGKYGYIDPDGNKREYEYQQGNPCDPNKKDEPEEEEDDVERPTSQQKLGGILTARPGQIQGRPRPVQIYQ